MAEVGLSTPLHLAASLLGLSAGVGLAVLVLARPGSLATPPRRERPLDYLLAAGALAIAVSHGLRGALVPGSADITTWLYAIGLALIAIGLSPRRLVARVPQPSPSASLRRSAPGAAVIAPIASLPGAAVVSAGAGVVGAVRAFLGGRRTLLIGLGLLAWGASQPMALRSLTVAAVLTIFGATAIGLWLWEASAPALLAKFVTASVAILLAVVVLIAGVLGSVGSRDIVAQELERLGELSETTAATISESWLEDAVRSAGVLSGSGRAVVTNVTGDADLGNFFDTFFNEQDFFVVLDAEGGVLAAYDPPDDPVLTDGFVLQLLGSPIVSNLLQDGVPTDSALLRIGGRFVGVGAAALRDSDNIPESDPVGAVITGRVADAGWARLRAQEVQTGVILTAGDAAVTSPRFSHVADEVAAIVGPEPRSAAVTLDGQPYYLAASPIRDLDVNAVVGSAVTLIPAAGLANVEQSQARGLFLLALLGALGAGGMAALVSRRLVAPIQRLTEAAAAIRGGRMSISPTEPSEDEVGVLERTFGEMTRSLAQQAEKLREAADVQSRLRARLEALTISMSDALVAVDPSGRVVTFNPAAERLVGRRISDALGRPLDAVLTTHPRTPSVLEALGASNSEKEAAAQLLLQRGDGRMVPTAATAAPMHDPNGVFLGRVLVLRDVTRETEIERMKTEFLSNVSHELRTPLTPIKGYAEVLARREVGEEATRRFASQILQSTGRLERIVGMIVDFAALDSGRLQLRQEAVLLSDLVGDVLRDWRERHPERDFRRRVGKNLPAVLADQRMLHRCLDELLDNAIKFSPGGEPVTISASVEVASAQRLVQVTVRDRGVGIDPDTRSRVFHDFYQADASETRQYGGLGLGLALVRRIVDGLGGDVVVESDPGRGSVFSLLLPVADLAPSDNGHKGHDSP